MVIYNDYLKTMSVTEFKARCLEIIRTFRKTGEPVLLTVRGKPEVEVRVPGQEPGPKFQIGKYEGTGRVVGDIVSPLDVEWEALK